MNINEIINEDMSRRGFLRGLGAAAAGAAGLATAKDAKADQNSRDVYSYLMVNLGVFIVAGDKGVINDAVCDSLIKRTMILLHRAGFNEPNRQLVDSGLRMASKPTINRNGLTVMTQGAIQTLEIAEAKAKR